MTPMTSAPGPAGGPEPVWRSDVGVELVRASASDADVVTAARVSTAGEHAEQRRGDDPAAHAGLIRYLLRNRHGTPFEHNSMTFLVSAPIFVFREFQRHRTWSYNEESARYRELEPVFYVAGEDRHLVQVGKAGHYTFEPGSDQQRRVVADETRRACSEAYASYRRMLEAGVAREVARGVLPVATYSSMYATCNARSLMAFLSLRTKHEDSAFPSYPQREIEMVAEGMEGHFARLMPLTYDAFVGARRVAP